MNSVYLAGPIFGTGEEASGWRTRAACALSPLRTLDPMRRDFRGVEAGREAEIVEGDKVDIAAAAAMLAYCPVPSFGTAMEILYAHQLGKLVAVVTPAPVSPWLTYHATRVFVNVEDAVEWLRESISRG